MPKYKSSSRWTFQRRIKKTVEGHLADIRHQDISVIPSLSQAAVACNTIDIDQRSPSMDKDLEHHFDYNSDSQESEIEDGWLTSTQSGSPSMTLGRRDQQQQFEDHMLSHSSSDSSENETRLAENDENNVNISNVRFIETDRSNHIQSTKPTIVKRLQQWAMTHNVTHLAITDLLSFLNPIISELPKDSRTLLQTITTLDTVSASGGEYYHLGLQCMLKAKLKQSTLFSNTTIMLQINVDGLPLFKSTRAQFWPILARAVTPVKTEVFPVGIYYGNAKPANLDFMDEFIAEMKQLMLHGLTLSSCKVKTAIYCFSADAPARALLKGIISHNGYYGCEKCVTKGEYFVNCVSFPQLNAKLRTDESFRKMENEGHHTKSSPLCEIVNMITQFPYDYMHLVCLGVMKRLLNIWLHGPLAKRLKKAEVQIISEKLLSIRASIPMEFARQTRSLKDIAFWKATEFRLFVLYVGPVVLKNVLAKEYYDHFMQFSVALCILVDPYFVNTPLVDFAHDLLCNFIKMFQVLYPSSPVVYNIHSLAHLANDVKLYGPLDNFSCFAFETYLGGIKKLVRGTTHPLPQVVHRLLEKHNLEQFFQNQKVQSSPQFFKEHNLGPLTTSLNPSLQQYKKYTSRTFSLTNRSTK